MKVMVVRDLVSQMCFIKVYGTVDSTWPSEVQMIVELVYREESGIVVSIVRLFCHLHRSFFKDQN